jgi:hypothetical protein
LGSDKEASLFLLRAGIDGIRYPEGSLSGKGTTSKNMNYVVFDESAVTIDEHIQFSLSDKEALQGDKILTQGQLKNVKEVTDRIGKSKEVAAILNSARISEKLYNTTQKAHDSTIQQYPKGLQKQFLFGNLPQEARDRIAGRQLMTTERFVNELSSILGENQAQAVLVEAGFSGYNRLKPQRDFIVYDNGKPDNSAAGN